MVEDLVIHYASMTQMIHHAACRDESNSLATLDLPNFCYQI